MTTSKKVGITLIIVIIIALVVIVNQTKQSEGVLKIGLMAPLSGEYATAGQNIQKGVELALDNYKNENPNIEIQLIVEDDGFVVQKGITAFKKLRDIDDVDVLIMVSTPVIDAIHEDVKKTDLIVMQIGIQTVGVTDDNIFQTSPAPELPIKLFAEYLEHNLDFKNTAVLYDNTAGGLVFFDSFKSNYKEKFDPMMISNKSDIKNYATKIASGDYDAVVVFTSPENGALAFKEVHALDTTPPVFAFDAQLQTGFADYERILGSAKELDGSFSMWIKSGNIEKFKSDYVAKFNTEPAFWSDFGYDSFNIMMNVYDKDKSEWKNNIQNQIGEGVSGSISFDENGVRIQDIVINKVIDGKIVPVQ